MTLNLATQPPTAAKREMTADDLRIALGECLGLLEALAKVAPVNIDPDLLTFLDASRQSPIHLRMLLEQLQPQQRR